MSLKLEEQEMYMRLTPREKELSLIHIFQDRDGQIQIYVRKDVIGEDEYEVLIKRDVYKRQGMRGLKEYLNHQITGVEFIYEPNTYGIYNIGKDTSF